MINLNNFFKIKLWWDQFPFNLKLITKIRFFASFGAGGVIYLTSLIFYKIGLNATEIGLGFAISAIIGTLSRFLTGRYLNFTGTIQYPLTISSFLSITASLFLLVSKNSFYYIIGQALIGAAAGIYWPSAEFAVPYFCYPIDSRKAFALVRSSEALGIFLGVFLGSFLNSFFYFKSIYVNDVICMGIILLLIKKNKDSIERNLKDFQIKNVISSFEIKNKWNKNTPIIIACIFLITTCLALIQVTLPLDFVKGGINRNPLNQEITSYIISFQLVLILIFQWPIGSWISNKGRFFGLKLSLFNFSIATIFLFISSYLNVLGFYLVFASIFLITIATASFLPTSTDLVFGMAPKNKKGLALALLSQCFAMGYFFGPFISGRILDIYGFASIIWLSISIVCFFMFSVIFKKKF